MKRVKNLRKARFRSALAMTGHTQASWAAAVGVPESVLSLVLDGKRENAELTERIEAFAAKHGATSTADESAA